MKTKRYRLGNLVSGHAATSFSLVLYVSYLEGFIFPVRMREAMTVVDPVAFERKRENGTDKAGPSGNEDASSASLH